MIFLSIFPSSDITARAAGKPLMRECSTEIGECGSAPAVGSGHGKEIRRSMVISGGAWQHGAHAALAKIIALPVHLEALVKNIIKRKCL